MNYTKLNNTYFAEPKDGPKDRISVEIGDSKQKDFYPQMKIMRWDNEVNFSARLKTDVEQKPSKVGEKIKTENIHFYDLGNGYEFEVILKEKPLTNVVEFTIEDKGVEYFYQPELTQEEIDKGAHRPDNVIGSYAVYASEQKTNYVGGKEYKCGKVGHIYRPRIEDANGDWVWGELKIDKGILSVAIPQDFLDKAVYPVRHAAGLTFGYDTAGGSQVSMGNATDSNWYVGYRYAMGGSAGNASNIKAYVLSDGPPEMPVKGIIHLQSDRSIISNGVSSNANLPGSASWLTLNFETSPSLLASTDYFLGLVEGTYTGMWGLIYYDSGTSNYGLNELNNYTTPTGLISSGNNSYKYSIYATYTAGATNVTVTPSALSLTSSLKAPVVSRSKALAVAAALALSLALASPSYATSDSYTPSAQQLALTLKTIVVHTTFSDTSTPDALPMNLTLNSPSYKTSDSFTPSAQQLSLTLPTPTTQQLSFVFPTTGRLSFVLKSPLISVSDSIIPSTQSLSLVVKQPTIIFGRTSMPTALGLSLAIPYPTLRISNPCTISPPPIQMGLSLKYPFKTAEPLTSALSLTLKTPVVSIVDVVPVNSQSLSLALKDPTVYWSGLVTPAARQLLLSVRPPVVQLITAHTVLPSTQNITMTLNAPAIRVSEINYIIFADSRIKIVANGVEAQSYE